MKTLLIPSLLCLATLQAPAAVIAAYQFDETSGNAADDSIRNGVNTTATLVNFSGSQWTAGKIGNALQFDGTNDFAWAADPVASGTTNLTISAWINLENTTPTTWSSIVTNWGGSGAYLFGFSGNTGAAGKLSNYFNTTGTNTTANTATTADANWHHVALTYAAGTSKLYFDGALMTSTNTGTIPATLTSSLNDTMGIGAKLNSDTGTTAGAPPGYFKGKIDDLVYFDTALTQTEINTIITNANNGISAVPEPSAALLGGLGVLALLRRRRL